MADISEDIERISRERHEAWREHDVARAEALSKKLDALYDEKRRSKATHGSPKAHKAAMRRAVAERELDRLMQA